MPNLKNSKVFRGGITANNLSLETRSCSFYTNTQHEGLDLRFSIASKGGGTTSVLFRLGTDDFAVVLESIAEVMPETATLFSRCASIANEKNIELLTEARRVKDNEKTRAERILENLEFVEEFISEKFYEAPHDGDERESAVKDKLDEVISSLYDLT